MSWVCALLLLVNVLFVPSLDRHLTVDDQDEPVICSLHSQSAASHSGLPDQDDQGQSTHSCVFCLSLNNAEAGILPSVEMAPPPVRLPGVIAFSTRQDELHTDGPLLGGHARGPPAAA